MNLELNHYKQIAEIFDYPGDSYTEQLLATNKFLVTNYPEAATEIQPFTAYMSGIDKLDQQELFIRSFDVQSLTTLDLGYVLFGDDYKRGELLVNLNREHRAVDNDCGHELADYLPNVLRLIPKLQDDSFKLEFIEKIVAPALIKMIEAFEDDQVESKEKFYLKKYKTIIKRPVNHYTIYRRALNALFIILKQDFNFYLRESTEKTSDFLKNIGTEMLLEDK